jgi:hypothetical protein
MDQLIVGLILLAALVFAGIVLVLIVLAKSKNMRDAIKRWIRGDIDHPYSVFNPGYYKTFLFARTFTARSFENFKIQYELEVLCHRRDDEEFKRARMLDKYSQQQVVEEFNEEIFLPHLSKNSRFFYFDWRVPRPDDVSQEVVQTPVGQFMKEDGEVKFRWVTDTMVGVGAAKAGKVKKNGCEVQFGSFRNNLFPDELIEENYAMLTAEDKRAIEADDRYGPLVEMIAVAALKRRLEFIGRHSNQKHEAEMFSIESERAGQRVRIRWKRKSAAFAGYELLGFRTTGGFHADEFDESNNGTLVIQSYQDGEDIQPLREGEANFYTFFMRSQQKQEDGSRRKVSPLRFQLAISAKEETEGLRAAIERLEQRKPADPARESMAQALKELGLAMEFQDALEAMEKTLIEQVRQKRLPKEEEEEKIEFIRDTVRLQRDKYQP